MPTKIVVVFSIYIVLSTCSRFNGKGVDVTELNLVMTFQHHIPDSTASDIYFNQPDYVVTDSDNNIIVADKSLNKLFFFNKQGEYKYQVGERGRGPSEFLNINGMSISSSDDIYIFDQSLQTVKLFDSKGEHKRNYNLEVPRSKVNFEFWKNYNLIISLDEVPREKSKRNLVHVHDINFDRVNSFISYDSFTSLSEELVMSFISMNGNNHFVRDDTLYLSTNLYDGYVYQYVIQEDDNNVLSLSMKNRTQGFVFRPEPAERFKGQNLKFADATATLAGGQKYQFLLYNLSKGLFRLENGHTVHFTYIQNEEPKQRVFGVELYNKNMEFLGYSTLKTIPFDPDGNNFLSWNVVWKDDLDRFYLLDKTPGHDPRINVFTLDGLPEN